MSPTQVEIQKQYRNSRYPETVYLGIEDPTGNRALLVAKTENKEMEGRLVIYDQTSDLNIDFWDRFTLTDSIEITPPPIKIVNEPLEEVIVENTGGRGRPKIQRAPLTFPKGEFSVKELAEHNGLDYPIVFIMLKEEIELGKVVFSREERRSTKGPMTKLFKAIDS